MLSGQLALVAAAIFTGAAFYVSAVEQPARLALDDRAALVQWKPAYQRGTLMQAPLAIVGFMLGALAFCQSGEVAWLVGAVLMILNWPYTLIAIMPTNRELTACDVATAGRHSRELLERWGLLHGGRTALGLAAMLSFLFASTI